MPRFRWHLAIPGADMTIETRSKEQTIWQSLAELRSDSGLKFDEYAKLVLCFTFLSYGNRKSPAAVRLPETATWKHLVSVSPPQLADELNKAMRAIEDENPSLSGTLQIDFNRAYKEPLHRLVHIFSEVSDTEDDDTFAVLFHHFLERFAQDSGRRAGEFSTPSKLTSLLARLANPTKGMSVYDPCAGTGGRLKA